MLLPSYTFSSDPLLGTAPSPAATPTDPRAFARGREAAARRHGHTYKRKYVEIALRVAEGGVRPAYARAFPPLLAEGPRTVDDFVRWLASPERPAGIDPAEGKLSLRRALRKRQQVVRAARGYVLGMIVSDRMGWIHLVYVCTPRFNTG